MKKFLFRKRFSAVFILLISALLILGTSGLGIPDIIVTAKALLFGGGGVSYAVAAAGQVIAGESPDSSTEGEKATDLYRESIDRFVMQLSPDKFPLDTIMRNKQKSSTTKAWEFGHYESDIRGVASTMGVAFTKSTDGTAPNYSEITVTSDHIFLTDDTIYVPGVDGGDGSPLVLAVAQKNADGKLWVYPLNGVNSAANDLGDYVPSIPLNEPIYRLGNAKAEKDAKTDPYTILPGKRTNYLQRFMCQVEQSVISKVLEKEADWNIDSQKLAAMYSMRSDMESSFIWGKKAKIFDKVSNEWKYFTGGVVDLISKNLEWSAGSGIDNAWFNSLAKYVFSGNNGHDKRMMFCGSNFMEALQNSANVAKQLEAKKSTVVAGVRVFEIETAWGVLLLKHHHGLDRYNQSDNGIILDMTNVKKKNLVGRKLFVENIDFKSSGEKAVDAQKIEEIGGLQLSNLDTHCLITKGV